MRELFPHLVANNAPKKAHYNNTFSEWLHTMARIKGVFLEWNYYMARKGDDDKERIRTYIHTKNNAPNSPFLACHQIVVISCLLYTASVGNL